MENPVKKLCKGPCKQSLSLDKFGKKRATCKECEKKKQMTSAQVKEKFKGQLRVCKAECKKEKPIEEFDIDKNNYRYNCKECRSMTVNNNYQQQKENIDKIPDKKCNTCGRLKSIKEFGILRGTCKSCEKEKIVSPEQLLQLHNGETKQCENCEDTFLISSFEITKNYFRNVCIGCRRQSQYAAVANKAQTAESASSQSNSDETSTSNQSDNTVTKPKTKKSKPKNKPPEEIAKKYENTVRQCFKCKKSKKTTECFSIHGNNYRNKCKSCMNGERYWEKSREKKKQATQAV
jgi:hypothetical protein